MKQTNPTVNWSAPIGSRLQSKTSAPAWMAVAVLAWCPMAGALRAADLPVPNASFESPTVPGGFPALPLVDSWQKAPQPAWFDPALTGGITWDQLAGVFPNPAPGDPARIDNLLGNQAAYMIAAPEVTLFQDLTATYQAGLSYHLSVGLLGAGGMAEGSIFQMGLYYRNAANQPVPLALLPVTFSAGVFPTATHLVDFEVGTPVVQPGDAWAGQTIGIQLLSAFGTGAGYWDLDNVRLVAVPEPTAAGLLALGLGAWLWLRRRAVPPRGDR
jgi:hypothetical protein